MAKPPNFTGYSHEQMKALLDAGRAAEDQKTGLKLAAQLIGGTVLVVGAVALLLVSIASVFSR